MQKYYIDLMQACHFTTVKSHISLLRGKKKTGEIQIKEFASYYDLCSQGAWVSLSNCFQLVISS